MKHLLRLALIGSALPLAGCMTTGTNMHGDFACRAPNGTCAPMSSIDAKAVSGLGAGTQPVGGIADPTVPREGRVVTASADGSPPGRTSDRVLRVVFPAHIDASGIYHDESTAHAVVEHGGWTDGLTGGTRRTMSVETAVAVQPGKADALQTGKLATLRRGHRRAGGADAEERRRRGGTWRGVHADVRTGSDACCGARCRADALAGRHRSPRGRGRCVGAARRRSRSQLRHARRYGRGRGRAGGATGSLRRLPPGLVARSCVSPTAPGTVPHAGRRCPRCPSCGDRPLSAALNPRAQPRPPRHGRTDRICRGRDAQACLCVGRHPFAFRACPSHPPRG